jgi:hypothetical protein
MILEAAGRDPSGTTAFLLPNKMVIAPNKTASLPSGNADLLMGFPLCLFSSVR